MIRKYLLTGLVLFLLITNIATIVTVIVLLDGRTGNSPAAAGETVLQDTINVPDFQRVRFFTDRLGLDAEQQEAFRRLSMDYGRSAKLISLEMNSLRDNLLDEMDRLDPDPKVLDSLSGQIGRRHVELKQLTIGHYRGLKSHCRAGQQRELYNIFKNIVNPEGEVLVPRGVGRRMGAGPPDDRGPRWRMRRDSMINRPY